jgi:hypothetical protein
MFAVWERVWWKGALDGVYRYRFRSNWLERVAFTLTATFVQVSRGRDWIEHGVDGRET